MSGVGQPSVAMGLFAQVRAFASLVKLSHTVFGLPFALASAVLAHRFALSQGVGGLDWGRGLAIVVAFTGARAAAMGFNRIADRHIDGQNPRTADRELPRGVITLTAAWALTLASVAVFVAASAWLSPLAGWLSLPCLVVLFGYSLFKRFSWSAHLVLGLALALAPGGAWIAVTGGVQDPATPVLLMVAVATWVAGFDVLYSLQDEGFDRASGLHSIPARFGTVRALVISALLHVATLSALIVLHVHAGLGWVHALGIAGICVVLAVEHAIVRPGDLSRLSRAFFDLNGWVSLGYLATVLIDVFV